MKIEERGKTKTTSFKECRRPNNQLKKETNSVKEICMEEIYDKIMDLRRNGRYDLRYQKVQLGRRSTKSIRILAIKVNQGNTVTDHRQGLKIWVKEDK